MLARLAEFLHESIGHKGTVLESLLFVAAYVLLLSVIPAGSPAGVLVENSAILTAAATAALLVFLSLPSMPAHFRRPWLLLGIAALGWLAGDFLLEYVQSLIGKVPAVAAVANTINLLAYALAAYSLLQYPFGTQLAPTRFRFILDALISGGVVVTLGFLVLAPPLGSPSATIGSLIIVSYPIADCILLVVLANASMANWVPRRTAVFLLAAWIAFLVSDYIQSSLLLLSADRPSGFVSLGWVCGFLLIGLGAYFEREQTSPSKIADFELSTFQSRRVLRFDLGVQFQKVLPVALVLVLLWYVLMDWRLRGAVSPYGLWMSILLVVMLIVRLGIRAGEAELNEYWQLFRNLALPSFVSDSEGNVLLENPAYASLSGMPYPLKRRRSLFDTFEGPLRTALEKGATQDQTVDVGLIGRGVPYSISLSPIIAENRRILIAGVAHDLSEQNRQRDAIQSAYEELQHVHQALEELNVQLEQKVEERTTTLKDAYSRLEDQNRILQGLDQIKSDFVSLVSHELRAPLTNLSGGLELLLQGEHKLAEQRILLLIQAEIRRLSRFVDSILNISAIESGHYLLHPIQLSLPDLVGEVRSSWSNLPEFERIRLTADDELPLVWGDENALRSVLGHLIDNALKYAPASPVEIRTQLLDGRVRVDVRDFGPGIPEDKQNLLFERFQRLESKDSQAIYGYGLGLYLSRQLLRALDSDLCFQQPETGGGALFYFYLRAGS